MENYGFIFKVLTLLVIALAGGIYIQRTVGLQSPRRFRELGEGNQSKESQINWNAYPNQEDISFYTFEGELTVRGYLETEHRACAFQNIEECSVDYAFFVTTKTNHPAFFDWLEEMKGNAFVKENAIGLGCYQKDQERIYSVNSSDEGDIENIIQGQELNKLLDSSSNNQVILRMDRLKLFGGTEAPTCYSHFRNFEVLQ
ncbi:MAG: hypothetical protein U9M98_00050 [Patescibacteria group bacterium]|nr:hypothetical protein [Patescibacteria group bacterium]